MRATLRVLKPGGRNIYYVINTALDISDADRERLAQRQGNDKVEAGHDYDDLMRQAGFGDISMEDVTSQYLETCKLWKEAWEADREALIELVGEEDYETRINNRRLDIEHASEGIVKRFLVCGVKPS